MELKVWVDGIKRVVCGVTDNTTCQDIVIALAHAMGRTGRFTLIEKWRDNERPLSPSECPLQVLQKWGEFANEVTLCLYESGSKRHKKHEPGGKVVPKTQDQFTHNFTPPAKPSEANVKRSLTFSGARNTETQSARSRESHEPQQRHLAPQDLSKASKLEPGTTNGTSWSSSSSLSSQNSGYLPPQQKNSKIVTGLRRRPSPQPPLQHSTPVTPKTQHSNHLPSPRNVPNQSFNQNQTHHRSVSQSEKQNQGRSRSHAVENRTSAFSPVRPRRNSHEEEVLRIPDADIPVYTERKKSSHKPEIEEYDLDSNFPDVVKETGRDYLIEEYHVPGDQGQGHLYGNNNVSKEEQERIKLLRLVTMQNERIKMQDSQIELADTEILSREEKQRETEQEIQVTIEDILRLSQQHEDLNKDLAKLENGHWIQDMDVEKEREKELKAELGSLKVRLEKCENSLHQFQTKVKICNDELEKEKLVMEKDEKRRREEEIKIRTEISEIQKDLDERCKDVNDKTKLSEEIEKELSLYETQLKEKDEALTALEKHLQKENLKFFQEPHKTDLSKSSKIQENGEAVLKVLEGSISPDVIKNRKKIINSPMSILQLTKTQTGVWV